MMELMKKYGISQEELQEGMRSLGEFEANEFMDMALADVKKIANGRNSKEELAFKLYRAYMLGFIFGQNAKDK